MFRKLASAALLSLPLMLGACEEQPSVWSTYTKPSGTWQYMEYASVKGPMLLWVKGNPYDMSKDALDQSLATMMGPFVTGREVQFTTDAAAASAPNFRTFLLFNLPESANARLICKGEIPAAVEPGQHHSIHGVFCNRDGLLSSVRALTRKDVGVEDQFTKAVIKGIVNSLYVKAKN